MLSEVELEDIINAIYDDKIEYTLTIWLFDLELGHEYKINFGKYNGKNIYFQARDDWDIIYSSISIKD